jgi:hypothetical protein
MVLDGSPPLDEVDRESDCDIPVREGVLATDTRGLMIVGGPIDPVDDPFPATLTRVLLARAVILDGGSISLRSLLPVSEVTDGGRDGAGVDINDGSRTRATFEGLAGVLPAVPLTPNRRLS